MKKHNDWLFLIPGMTMVAVVTQVPFLLTLVYSTLRWNLARPDLPVKFYGFKNFWYFLRIQDWSQIPEFYYIVWQTIHITSCPDVMYHRRLFARVAAGSCHSGREYRQNSDFRTIFCDVYGQRGDLENHDLEHDIRMVWRDRQISRIYPC